MAIGEGVALFYKSFLEFLPFWMQNFINLFSISLIIIIYSILVWKFYRFIAKKDLLELNLSKYNQSEHPFFSKIWAGLLYILEYIIILPLLVFLWFAVFTIFLIFLTESLPLQTILIISATVITAIRMAAYYKEDLARDLAKLLPFTLLGVAITQGIFSFEKIITQFFQIPEYFSHITIYLIFILVVELILRILDILFISTGIHEEESVKED